MSPYWQKLLLDAHASRGTHDLLAMLTRLLVSTRPREWIKNAFVFAALFFSQNLFNVALVSRACLAFGLYCMAAGGVYLMNDINDREEDKRHPQKRTRPIASDALPVTLAGSVAVVLMLLAVGGAWHLRPAFGFITGAYVLLSIAYAHGLKRSNSRC